jgi:hypothetical protein
MYSMKKQFIFLLLGIVFALSAKCQQVIPGMEVTEIFNIAETYRQVPHLSFDMQFQYADSANPGLVIEQLSGNYKLQNGKMRSRIDSTEYLRGNVYNLTIFRDDSIISVDDRQPDNNLFQMPFLDSVFRNQNIDSMLIAQPNDSTRILTIKFVAGTAYSNYELQYDYNTYLIKKVKYTVPANSAFADTGDAITSIVTILFSNYDTQIIEDSNFDEAAFIKKQGEEFVAQPAYSGFKIFVNTSY